VRQKFAEKMSEFMFKSKLGHRFCILLYLAAHDPEEELKNDVSFSPATGCLIFVSALPIDLFCF
jgi:hypothetical protein